MTVATAFLAHSNYFQGCKHSGALLGRRLQMCESMQGAATVEVGPAPSDVGRFKDCTSAAAWEGQQQDGVPQTKTFRVQPGRA